MTLYLFAEMFLLNLGAFAIGLGAAWVIWGRQARED